MGRGRQKAKQTKVARQLKYFSPNTDYDALQRELATSGDHPMYAPAEQAGDASDEDLEDDDEDLEDDPEDLRDDDYAGWAREQRR